MDPRRKTVEVVGSEPGFGTAPLEREPGGYHSGLIPHAANGSLYRFRLDGGDCFPDPASRFQPEGPHGWSQVVDPALFRWTDKTWPGIRLEGQVIYEMHIGTFTRQGTFDAARRELPELAPAGISVIEIMPIADFPGRFGWGYDGVGLFAPVAIYGRPDDFRRFVDDAHHAGIGVILDVVYNHVGPDGNYLRQFSEDYFTSRYENDWGEAINYDGANSAPAIHFRPHEAPVTAASQHQYVLTVCGDHFEITAGSNWPTLRLLIQGPAAAFTFDRKETGAIPYRTERSRGYEWLGSLWSPGYFRSDLGEGDQTTLTASTENWEAIGALNPTAALCAELDRRKVLLAAAPTAVQTGPGAELVLAADQFLITPVGRVEDAARAPSGDEIRTVIAGYHWFTDCGRDSMIALEGLTLTTGRQNEAGWILRTFAHYIRDGLIPNMFPEGEKEGLYHTADATLWFFHALHRYIELTGDRTTLRLLLPKLSDIVEHHIRGTRFGIRMEPSDALLQQGQPGYQLTWMDAKVDDWVVTPRRGKAVEINALWYNALRLLERWLLEEKGEGQGREISETAARAQESFNRRFWFEQGGYLYDVGRR